MKNVKRVLYRAICAGLALVLVACGNGGKGIPPEEKHVVIGTADHIKANRHSTHHLSKPLPFGVTHQRFKDGKQLSDDAPHPFTLSSGSVLVDARKNTLLQVAYHEDKVGRLSQEIPASFHISDTSIVSEVRASPGTNAALLTLTGKKGNSYITALDARGDAISKFMVLSAEPQEDVLVVDDPDIRPMLCSSRGESRFGTVCDYATSTSFDWGESGSAFSIDHFLKSGTSAKKYLMFDDRSIEKLKKINTNNSSQFNKRAIYFEIIDTLVVMEAGTSTVERMAVIGRNPLDPSDKDPANDSLYLKALPINYVATQEEFNTYIDFGGQLTSSPLRDFEQVDKLEHEIAPGSGSEFVLVGVQYGDGSEQLVSQDALDHLVSYSRQPIAKHLFAPKQEGRVLKDLRSGVMCRLDVSGKTAAKVSLSSFKTTATVGIGGEFKWNNGKAQFGVNAKPAVEMGGQIGLVGGRGLAFECSLHLKDLPVAEVGIPIFGSAQILIPVEGKFKLKWEDGVSGKMVLITPKFVVGSGEDLSGAGKTGFTYSPNAGINSEFDIGTSFSRSHLGFAEGTEFNASQANAERSQSLGFETGLSLGLVMSAKTKLWILDVEVVASLLEAMVGLKAEGAYDFKFDSDSQSYRYLPSEKKTGIGIFLESKPTISFKTNFFSLSLNLIDFGERELFFFRLPYSEPVDEKFEPADNKSKITFLQCINQAYGRVMSTDCDTPRPHTHTRDYIYSTQQISFDQLPYLPGRTFVTELDYVYEYIYLDKITGKPIAVSIPAITEGRGDDAVIKINKYGATGIVAESIRSSTANTDGGSTCWIWFRGDEQYRTQLQRCQ